MDLSYLNLKSVLRYIEPNLRIQLSKRCPAIDSMKHQIPFHIDQLKINEHSLTINNTIYKLEVVTSLGSRANLDLDHFGAVDLTTIVEQGPDEILIDGRIDYTANDHNTFELEQIRSEMKRVSGILDEEEKARALAIYKRRSLMHQVNTLRYFARYNHVTPRVTMIQIPMSFYTKLFIGKVLIETVNGNKLHKALKYLLESLFGAQKPVKIEKLHIRCAGILRIPLSINFQFQHLKMEENTEKIAVALQPMIDKLQHPLESLEVDDEKNWTLDAPIYQSARLLVLNCGTFPHEYVGKRNIRFKNQLEAIPHSLNEILDELFSIHLDIGTCWSFALDLESDASLECHVSNRTVLSVTFPIGRLAELHVSYEEYKDRQESSWDVKFKIRTKN